MQSAFQSIFLLFFCVSPNAPFWPNMRLSIQAGLCRIDAGKDVTKSTNDPNIWVATLNHSGGASEKMI